MLYSASALLPFQQLLRFKKRNCHAPGGFQPIPLFFYNASFLHFSFFFFFFHPPEPSGQKVVPAEAVGGSEGGSEGGEKKLLSRSGFHLSLSLPPLLLCSHVPPGAGG